MTLMRTLCLVSLGGLIENMDAYGSGNDHGFGLWLTLLLVSACGWGWYGVAKTAKAAAIRFRVMLTGQSQSLPTTDPQALAAEMAALNAQISQLRDTATSFDMSFDQTLERLDERLRRLEQQSAYVQVGQGR